MKKFNFTKFIKVLVFFILVGISIYYLLYKIEISSKKANAPVAQEGFLDVTAWDFQNKGFLKLDGTWEFYWLKLYTPEDFFLVEHSYSEKISKPSFQPVPSIWNNFILNGEKLGGNGFATYRLKIKVKDISVPYALKILDNATASLVWVNGQVLWKAGKNGKSKDEMEPSYKTRMVEFKSENDVIEIIIQVSNFFHEKGGIWNFIEFGYADNINDSRESQTGFEFFMFGSLCIMAFYHFGLYALRRKDKSTLYFGLVCITIGLRILLTGERYLFSLLDDSEYCTRLLSLEFISVNIEAPLVILFMESIFPEDARKIITKFTIAVGILFTLVTIFGNTIVLTRIMTYFEFIILFLILYLFYILILINVKKREGAFWIALGLIFFLATLANDLLYVSNLIFTGFFFPMGLFVFIFSQSFILSMRFSKAFATVESMSEKLLTLDKLKDDFMANTSHELRTPLNGIIGIAESMLDDTSQKLSIETKLNLSLIVASGRRLNSLVNDILDFSKLKNHEIGLQIKKIDLKQVTDFVLRLSEPLIVDKTLKLINEIPNDFPEVDADENRIIQIFHNLVGNAIKFTDNGEIKVSAKKEESSYVISISDTGIGIPETKLEHIFQSFEQMDNSISREYGGTGLGLSITKQLVELHGGKIWVSSTLNGGSTFYFTIPTMSSESSATILNEITSTSQIYQPQINAEISIPLDKITDFRQEEKIEKSNEIFTILAVDDEPINLQVMVNQLKDKNYRVLTANNGKNAITMVENEVPDLILLDVMMPKLSGFEVCKILREKYPIHTLPIIILSAKNQANDIIFGLECGANDYLHKPFHKKELLSRINNQLSIKQAIEDNSRLITMEKELQMAKKIQASILPEIIPTMEGISISTTYMPMHAVGGDLYDFHIIGKSEIGILIADVAGHGVSAAIIMGMVKLAFRMHKEYANDPRKILAKMNETLFGITGKGFVTAGYCYINMNKKEIEFSSAGHPALLVLKGSTNDSIELQPKGTILGAFPKINCLSEVSPILPGNKILLYTDGILEVRKDVADTVFYGGNEFKNFLQNNQELKGEVFLNSLIEDVLAFRDTKDKSEGFDDDITLVSIDIL